MRYSEFIQVPEEDSTASEDAFKSLMMLFKQNANNEKESSVMSWEAIQQYMSNIGYSMNYEQFKTLYDQKPELQSLVSDFNDTEVTINTTADAPMGDDPVEIPPDEKVSQMAKRALNKRDG